MNDNFIVDLISKYEKLLIPRGFEIKPFLIGWYNDKISENFRLKYSYNTLALNIINTPKIFSKTFLEYIKKLELSSLDNKEDLLDESVNDILHSVNNNISEEFFKINDNLLESVIIRDNEMNNVTRQPKVVVRAAGHVSGQVRYYQRLDIPTNLDPWGSHEKIFGCSFHDKYGGWFAFRGIIIFPQIEYSNLNYADPPDPLLGNVHAIIQLLTEFNFHWKTWKFRDLIDVDERYSSAFKMFLSLPPGKQRLELVKQWWNVLKTLDNSGDHDDEFCINQLSNGVELFDWGMR